MIVTLTANPAIDLNFTADRLVFDDRAYLLSRSQAPGGRGINASQVLQSFGVPTLAIAFSGGKAGDRFEEFLRRRGLALEAVRIKEDIRTNYSITDQQGLTVKLDERGPSVSVEEIGRLEEAVIRRLPEASWLLLCGSLPPGAPRDFYRRLVDKARQAGVKTLLDTDGEPLQEGLEAGPTVVAPNHREAERLLNRGLITRAHLREAVTRIQAMGAESVVMSLGSRGAIAGHDQTVTEVAPPQIDALCPIGAGDSLNAAFVWARTQGSDFVDAVRWGVAAGTATASLPGLNYATLKQTKRIYPKVEVRPAA
ncbi:MAG: 1-phosphofructokinase family hexose kinase [Bryobacteraceae bacterium]|nr:1-phosphofructokinase family hexose kinase [Bryobacteraceae bacterium]